MATHETVERNGKLRTTVKLEPGERVALCRCMQSKSFPFCDGTHNKVDGTTGPVIVEALRESREPLPSD